MPTNHGVVVVGAGIAGVSTVNGLLMGGFDGEIALIGDEPVLPYRRPTLSKEILRGEKASDQIRIKPEAWYEPLDLRSSVAGMDLDLEAAELTLGDGSTLVYDRLVLATGAIPRLLPGQTRGQARVRTLRTLADVAPLKELLAGRRAVVVGAGLIGAEFAASARELGCEVTILEAAPVPLPRMLPALIGERYSALHRAKGVVLETDVRVAAVGETESEAFVRSTDGREWSAPLVVVAIGVAPDTALAEKAGLHVENGIVVDEYGQTSAAGVYAVGDVANVPHPLGGRYRGEHWQGAQNHGTAVGRSLTGQSQKITEVPWAWSDQYGLNLQVTGWPDLADALDVDGSLDDLDFIARLTREGRLVGAIGIGRPSDIRLVRKQIAERVLGG